MDRHDVLEIIAIVFGVGLVVGFLVGFLVFVFYWGCEL